jgi:DNA polymerase I-like protein with 3'-5' exonuclease and polymerase domains
VIQGLASDITAIAATKLINAGYKVVLLVHDSIIVEVPEEAAEATAQVVTDTMVAVGTVVCPEVAWKADCDIVSRWGAKS